MADSIDALFVYGDDFEAILQVLEDDEAIEEEFVAAVSNVQSHLIVCSECGKTYKTRGGFERHKTAKHSQQQNGEESTAFTPDILDQIVKSALKNLQGNKVFSACLRKEFNNYELEMHEETAEFIELKTIFEAFIKSRNAEKFYQKYYAKVPLNSTRFFKGLSRNAATLLSTKVADCMLAHCKREISAESTSGTECNSALSERDGWPPVCWWICPAQAAQKTQHIKLNRKPTGNGNPESWET